MKEQLYFIAIVPGEPVQSEITEFKNISKQKFNSKKALNSPAHVTIVPPFKYNQEKEGELIDFLNGVVYKTKDFYLTCNGFNKFDKKVIFVNVEKNLELKKLFEAINNYLKFKINIQFKSSREFHPHITVAFRDLKQELFPEAWSYYSSIEYQRIFKVQSVCLLKHDSKKWNILSKIAF